MEQLPEVILIDDILHTLYTTPLLPWLRGQRTDPAFDIRTAACERGYVGRWRIHEGKLWLVGLYAWRQGQITGVGDLFPGQGTVAATWFSGPLVVEPAASEISDGAVPELRTIFVESGCIVGTKEGTADSDG